MAGDDTFLGRGSGVVGALPVMGGDGGGGGGALPAMGGGGGAPPPMGGGEVRRAESRPASAC